VSKINKAIFIYFNSFQRLNIRPHNVDTSSWYYESFIISEGIKADLLSGCLALAASVGLLRSVNWMGWLNIKFAIQRTYY